MVAAARNGDTSQLIEATARLQDVNANIKANGGRVSDAEFDYLSGWVYEIAKDPEAINGIPPDAIAADGTPLRTYIDQQYADGMLNLINGSEQNTDSGVAPGVSLPDLSSWGDRSWYVSPGGSYGRQLPVTAASIANILDQLESPQIEAATSKYQGTGDGEATVEAARKGDTDGLMEATARLQDINERYMNGGQMSDADYDYLYAYYEATAPYSAEIDNAVKGDESLKDTVGARYADGLLNLSRACEQSGDSDVSSPYPSYGPDGSTVFAGRGGLRGLPPAVLDILDSDIGKELSTYAGAASGEAQDLLRARWVGGEHGQWVVDNYDTATGFGDLLSYASKDVEGGFVFSQQLATTAIRWQQDTNTVWFNTTSWGSAVWSTYSSGPGKDQKEALGFPPDRDHALFPDINITDAGASGLLTAASHNPYASAHFLATDEAGRRAILGQNWQGHGAADFLASGTALDGPSECDDAAIKVIQDAGSDYLDFANVVSDPVKDALLYIALTHLESFGTPGGSRTKSEPGEIAAPGGKIRGLALTDTDAANYLKLISLLGPGYAGIIHDASIELAASWLQSGSNNASTHAQTLLGRVAGANNAATIDRARTLSGDQQNEYIGELHEQQEQARNGALLDGGLNFVYAGANIATFGEFKYVDDGVAALTALIATLDAGKDYKDYSEHDAKSPEQRRLIELGEQIQALWNQPAQDAETESQLVSDLWAAALKANKADGNAGPEPSTAYDTGGDTGWDKVTNIAAQYYGDTNWGDADRALESMNRDSGEPTVNWTAGPNVNYWTYKSSSTGEDKTGSITGGNKIVRWDVPLVSYSYVPIATPTDVTPG